MINGPVEVAFIVYEDFMSYKRRVYYYISGGILGGHAIKAIDWGTTDEGIGKALNLKNYSFLYSFSEIGKFIVYTKTSSKLSTISLKSFF